MSILSHSLESLLPFSLTKKKIGDRTKSIQKKANEVFYYTKQTATKEDDDYDGLTAITKAIEKNESMAFAKD